MSAVHAAYHIGAFAIICVTTSGKTAEYISKYRPQCPTVAITRYLLKTNIPTSYHYPQLWLLAHSFLIYFGSRSSEFITLMTLRMAVDVPGKLPTTL